MGVDRSRQISRLLHEAGARAEEERNAFLDAACEGDDTLRREVESLLANEARASAFLAVPAAETFATLTGSAGNAVAGVSVPGRMLSGYRIERLLGRGGMGSVFLAYDTTLHRHVALKMLEGPGDGDQARNRLLREARSAAALNHPNICTIHEIGEANGSAFIAMEYVEGRCLRDRLDEGAVPLDEAVHYGIQAANALNYAHDHGVIHRDFKAANIIVMAAGGLKIVDFGLAQRRDALMAAATTMASLAPVGAAAGTPYAMAPEQVRGEATDARTDVWALGVLLHEMVSGTKPFDAETTPELFSSILRDAPASMPDKVPAELRAVVERCLEKAPERRYQHASEVRVALEAIQRRTVETGSTWRHRLARERWFVAATSLVATATVLVALNIAGARDWLVGNPAEAVPVTLAVLPLENLTGDPEQEYLSDGLTDQMITVFSRLHSPQLSVIARTSSMLYKRNAKPLDQIGRELHANTVLKGSVTRAGDRVRIFAELLQTSNAHPLWSNTYERSVNELFTFEHDISNAVSSALRVQVPEPEKKGLAATHHVNPEAYNLYLRGLSHTFRDNEQDLDQAITLLERSAALDPAYVPAQAYLAMLYGNKSSEYRPNDPQWEEKGFAAVRRALNLDPDAPEAHYAQAMMLWRPSHGFPNREVLMELRKALAAQPNFDEAWHIHAAILMHVGHLDAAAHGIQRALEINPGNTAARIRFGPIYVYQQKFEEAIAALNRVRPEASTAQWSYYLPWALISLGRFEEAGRLVEEALKNNPVDQGGLVHAARAMLRAKRGDRKGAEADVAEAIRAGRSFVHFHHAAYSIGAVYATLGEFDRAQEWIENAADDGFPNYAYFETDVHLAGLRATPRFRAFLAKLRLEWEHIPGEPE
jgi:TolB-like protein/Tfp pilus assembly protein PilF/predicted Ser/Thr protein kinase